MALSLDNADFFTKIFADGKSKFQKAIFPDAIKHFQYCINRQYRVGESYFYTALSYLYHMNFREAFWSFQMSMVFSDQFCSGAHYYLGVLCDTLGNASDAQMYYKVAIDKSEDSLHPLMAYKALSRHGENPEYKKKATKGFEIQLDLSLREKFLIEAFRSYIEGDVEATEEAFILAKEEAKNSFESYFYLAIFYFHEQRYEDSLQQWIVLDKKFHLSSLGLSERMYLLYQLKDYKGALGLWKLYRKVIASPTALQYFHVGLLHTQLGQFNQAIFAYEVARKLDPNYFEAFFNLGVCFQRNGEFVKAIDAYNRAFALEQDNPTPLYNIGLIYFEQKEYIKALFYLYRVVEMSPTREQAKENIRYIEYLHTLDDKGFSVHNRMLFLWVSGILILVLGILGILHVLGVI